MTALKKSWLNQISWKYSSHSVWLWLVNHMQMVWIENKCDRWFHCCTILFSKFQYETTKLDVSIFTSKDISKIQSQSLMIISLDYFIPFRSVKVEIKFNINIIIIVLICCSKRLKNKNVFRNYHFIGFCKVRFQMNDLKVSLLR